MKSPALWRLWTAFAAMLVLAAPAQAEDEYARVHTIAVVATYGDEFVVKRVGVTVFGNSETTIPIPQWGIADFLTNAVSQALAPRFTVKPITLSPEMRRNCAYWANCLQRLPKDPSIDAYVFIGAGSVYLRGEGLDPHGIGLYRTGTPFGDDFNQLHAVSRVDVIDARNGDRIDYGTARLPESAIGGHMDAIVPITPAPLPDADSKLTDEQLESFKPKVMEFLERSYRHALINAHLLPDSADLPPAQ